MVLLRHGLPELQNCLLGTTDSKLSDYGMQQMEKSTQALESITKVVSSPLKRCLQFASKYSKQYQLDLVIDQAWQECDFGDWDGKNYQSIAEDSPFEYENFLSKPGTYSPPNAEKLTVFYHRVVLGIESILSRYAGEKVLLVTHGGVIRCWVAWCLKMDFLESTGVSNIPFQRIKIDYASTTQIDLWNEQQVLPQLVSLNHCQGGKVK